VSDLTKFLITCGSRGIEKCEAHAYQITARQQAAKILELETRLQIDTLNPNRREHIEKLNNRIDELNTYLDNIKDQLVNALSSNYELEKESKKLEKPAMVGAGIFREGVDKNLVIEAAQRHYEYQERSKALKDQG
jgi:hypothetical protein